MVEEVLLPSVSLPLSAFIPHDYIPTEALRIGILQEDRRLPGDGGRGAGAGGAGGPLRRPAEAGLAPALADAAADPVPGRRRGAHRDDKSGITLWLARRVENEEVKVLFRQFRRAQFMPDRVMLYAEPEKALAAVEQLVEALRARGREEGGGGGAAAASGGGGGGAAGAGAR